MPTPKFVQRVARLPELLAVLSAFPDGLSLRELADRFDTDPETIEQDLTSLHELESWGWTFDIFRTSVIEFAQPDDELRQRRPVDPSSGSSATARLGLGVEHISPGDLAMIYTAGVALLETDPSDTHLDEALSVIAETMYGEPGPEQHVGTWNRFLPALQDAVEHRRRSGSSTPAPGARACSTGSSSPSAWSRPGAGGRWTPARSGPRATCAPTCSPTSASSRSSTRPSTRRRTWTSALAAQRSTTTVRMVLAQDARWAADMYAEDVAVVVEDEDEFEADLELLPPAGERVALLMLASGPASRLIEPTALLPEAVDVVRELIRHHSDGKSDT